MKPVIDLADHVRVDAYEVPDRLKERIALRDLGCVFPWCTRPARTACDHDHAIPYDQGGSTCSCNIAPLCRHHHRLKTHTPWRYRLLEPGVYLWTSPHGYVFLRDPSGTTDVTPRRVDPHPPAAHAPTYPTPDRPGSYHAPTPRPSTTRAGTSARPGCRRVVVVVGDDPAHVQPGPDLRVLSRPLILPDGPLLPATPQPSSPLDCAQSPGLQ